MLFLKAHTQIYADCASDISHLARSLSVSTRLVVGKWPKLAEYLWEPTFRMLCVMLHACVAQSLNSLFLHKKSVEIMHFQSECKVRFLRGSFMMIMELSLTLLSTTPI